MTRTEVWKLKTPSTNNQAKQNRRSWVNLMIVETGDKAELAVSCESAQLLLFQNLAFVSILKMEAICSTETPISL
jgi:hypothetical protein